jgi:hypothetical protein
MKKVEIKSELSGLTIEQINGLMGYISEDTGEFSPKYLVYYLLKGTRWNHLSSVEFKQEAERLADWFGYNCDWIETMEEFNSIASAINSGELVL